MKKICATLILMLSLMQVLTVSVMANQIGIFSNTTSSNSGTTNQMDISSITKPSKGGAIDEKILDIGHKILEVISVVAVGIAVIMLIVVAIKYMAAAPNDKAEIKKHLVIYVVGAIFIFCCVGIVNLLKLLADGLFLS